MWESLKREQPPELIDNFPGGKTRGKSGGGKRKGKRKGKEKWDNKGFDANVKGSGPKIKHPIPRRGLLRRLTGGVYIFHIFSVGNFLGKGQWGAGFFGYIPKLDEKGECVPRRVNVGYCQGFLSVLSCFKRPANYPG